MNSIQEENISNFKDPHWPPGVQPVDHIAWLRLVPAQNPGPMTLTGTNTWCIAPAHLWQNPFSPNHSLAGCLIIDPGPALSEHVEVLRTIVTALPHSELLVTHLHQDHTEAIAPLVQECPTLSCHAVLPRLCRNQQPLTGTQLRCDNLLPGFKVDIIATPGHTADSVSLLVTGPDHRRVLFSGDTILGQGSSVIADPEGSVAEYLLSLGRLMQCLGDGANDQVLLAPGHGPVLPDARDAVSSYAVHRVQRLAQIAAAHKNLPTSVQRSSAIERAELLVPIVYAGVPQQLWPAATASMVAHVHYLDRFHGDRH